MLHKAGAEAHGAEARVFCHRREDPGAEGAERVGCGKGKGGARGK